MADGFLDANVFLRHLRKDHPEHSPRATALLARIEQGELAVRTADTVVFETIFTPQRTYRVPRAEIAAALLPLLELPGIVLPGKRRSRRVFALYTSSGLGFADCYHAVLAQQLRLPAIFSFDRHFDQVPGLRRRPPPRRRTSWASYLAERNRCCRSRLQWIRYG